MGDDNIELICNCIVSFQSGKFQELSINSQGSLQVTLL